MAGLNIFGEPLPFSDTDSSKRVLLADTKSGRRLLRIGQGENCREVYVTRSCWRGISERWDEAMKRNTVLLNCLYHEIHCPEDDPGAMFLILYIIHFKTSMLPQTLEFKQIVQLAKIAERYDLNHILIGYVDTWLAPYHARLLEAGFEEWLFVAWQFGLENHYFTLANHLAMNCQVDENFYLLEVGSDLPIVGTYPPDTLYLIAAARSNALAKLLSVTYTFLKDLLVTPSCQLENAPEAEKTLCTARNHWGLQRYLMNHKLYPYVNTARIRQSVYQTGKILTDGAMAEYMRRGSPDKSQPCPHDELCSVDKVLREKIIVAVNALPWAVDEDLIAQMRLNRARRGVPPSPGAAIHVRTMKKSEMANQRSSVDGA